MLTAGSDTFIMKDIPPASIRRLENRVNGDLDFFLKVLKAYGYFKAKVDPQIDQKSEPIIVVFHINPGPAFVYRSVELKSVSAEYPLPEGLPGPAGLGLVPNSPYRAEDVLIAEKKVLLLLGEDGRPFPTLGKREIVADFASNTVDITLKVDPGPKAEFGPVKFKGLTDVDEDYVRRRLPFKEGDPYKASLLTAAKSNLYRTDLFSTVSLNPVKPLDQGRVTIAADLTERKARTVRAGLSYQTDTKLGVRFGWEHRNLFGSAEKLSFSLLADSVNQQMITTYRKPDFLTSRQALLVSTGAIGEQTDAYDSRSLDNYIGVERAFDHQARAMAGVNYSLLEVTENGQETIYSLLSFPVSFKFDYTNDLLNPTRGGRLTVQAAPFTDTRGQSPDFFKYRVTYSHYLPLIKDDWLVLAGRGSYGSMQGAKLERLPKNTLFYAGGGGSVRGYKYQFAGDMELNNRLEWVPRGGLSIIELSGEVRFKVTESLGFVGFLDGGRAYESDTPGFDEDLFWGTGLGLRVYTPIGPVRLDVAVPLDKRDGIDPDYQIYISLGQAF